MDWSIVNDAKELKKECKGLSDYEALRIVVESRRNSILSQAFNVQNGEMPALEQIASAIGFQPDFRDSVAGAIHQLSDTIEENFGKPE